MWWDIGIFYTGFILGWFICALMTMAKDDRKEEDRWEGD